MPEGASRQVSRKYDFFSRFYDRLPCDIGDPLRTRIWAQATGDILEVGVGTGKSIPFYPEEGQRVTGIDFSPGMLSRAEQVKARSNSRCSLLLADVQHLNFPDRIFDTIVATCVFCTVPDPVAGLEEIRRVCRPGGRIILLEHVRSHRPVLGWLMDLASPLTQRWIGDRINRDTVGNVRRAGLNIVNLDYLWGDILVEIRATPD